MRVYLAHPDHRARLGPVAKRGDDLGDTGVPPLLAEHVDHALGVGGKGEEAKGKGHREQDRQPAAPPLLPPPSSPLPPHPSIERTARNASCGTSTAPTCFIRFFPSFCFSKSFRFRLMSPP